METYTPHGVPPISRPYEAESSTSPKTNPAGVLAPPRIGNGVALFVIGGLFLALGLFAAAAGAGGSDGASAIGAGAITLGGAIIAIGFWVNLFSKIEKRLIDIQQSIIQTDKTRSD